MECASRFACFKPHSDPKEAPKVDLNVIELNLSCLKSSSKIATGDPFYCGSCSSVLNSSSVLVRSDGNNIWTCEFCGASIVVPLEEEELPKHLELTYLLEAALIKPNDEERKIDTNTADQSAVVFCIDTSGSMAMTKAIGKSIKLKSRKGESSNVVSRLECMQAAVDSQIQAFLEKSPYKKVGIISFDTKVKVLGDGVAQEIMPRESMNEFDTIMRYCQSKRGQFLNLPIADSNLNLTEKLMSLRAVGGTALGPALLASILIASEGGNGSKVVICTDGLANEGIGALSNNNDQNSFYTEIASIANELGVSVSVISIEGQECRLESLAIVTDATGGNIVKVAPENLESEFANAVNEDIIATQVSVQVILNKAIKFAGEPNHVIFNNGTRLEKFIGNATSYSNFAFRYELKSDEELGQLGIDKFQISQVPIQALFKYSTLDGRKCLRTITKILPVTFNREAVNNEVNVEVLARAGRNHAIKLAEEGRLEEAKKDSDMWVALVKEEAKEGKLELIKELDEDMMAINSNIEKHLHKEEELGIRSEEIAEERKAERRKNYGDDFVVGMSKLKKKR